MPDLLLELFSEEIPARMQRRAAEDLRRLVTDALVERGFLYEGAGAYATPRRLALTVAGLPPRGQDVREERKGPRVGAPEAAISGFLKSAGLASIEEAVIERDPKKGEFYVARTVRPGRPTPEVLAEILPAVIQSFPWPKSMRWGRASAEPGSLRWVRPLHAITCTFGPETEEPEVVRFRAGDVEAGDVTYGHRFMAPGPIRVRRFDDYVSALEQARVVLDPERRKDIIRHDARDLAFAQGLTPVEDEGLLEEVAGLVEWPVVLLGAFDPGFLDIPPEVIRATIRANQKCFVLAKPDGGLSEKFILVSNLEAVDGGRAIVAGNERVVRARLSDAQFFWNTDRKPLPDYAGRPDLKPLDQRLERLKSSNIVFHQKLGTQGERVERIAALARELAPVTGADPDLAERAARLAKADLVTEMVGEFPELQGLMGRYYAAEQGEHPSVAAAIEEHYKPLGPSDRVPTDPVSVAVALADKLDTLVGFWAIDEKPTGSKDPYALRRAALGVIRLVLENAIRLTLKPLTTEIISDFQSKISSDEYKYINEEVSNMMHGEDFHRKILGLKHQATVGAVLSRMGAVGDLQGMWTARQSGFLIPFEAWERSRGNFFGRARIVADVFRSEWEAAHWRDPDDQDQNADIEASLEGVEVLTANKIGDLLAFFADRLKVYLRDQGARHDLIDAVFALPGQDDLLLIVRRVEALGRFLDTDDGRNLLAGYKRAANILRIEEKKDSVAYDGEPDLQLVAAGDLLEEKALVVALDQARREAAAAVAREDFEGAMRALSSLRAPVDAFFDHVTVNAPDPAVRANRLRLLNAIRAATREVADFSRIEG